MLKAIRQFFDQHIGQAAAPQDDAHRLHLATAALLVEVVRTDRDISTPERDAVLQAVGERFGLSLVEAATLAELAEQEAQRATDYYQFTSLINSQFSPQQKVQVIEMMWRAAYADGRLSAHEQHVLSKVADLLHVPHGDYIAAKMRARDATAG